MREDRRPAALALRIAQAAAGFKGAKAPPDPGTGRAGTAMRCLKASGDRIAAGNPDRQAAETRIRLALLDRLGALGEAGIARPA